MRYHKPLLLAFMLGLLTLPALAQPARAQNIEPSEWDMLGVYDLDSASFIYCNSLGLNGQMVKKHKRPPSGTTNLTAAASTTVTCTNCFTNVAVGDILYINDQGVMLKRVVIARASASSITISGAAVTLVNAPFEYRTRSCGTADTSGAIPMDGYLHSFTFQIDIDQENSASIDYQLQCRTRGPNATWGVVSGPTNQTGTGVFFVSSDLPFGECRVGLRVNTDDGGDTGVDAEQIDISFIGRR